MEKFKKGAKIVYPTYGVGEITDIYTEEIGDKEIDYYKVEFEHSKISVAVPVRRSPDLGLQKPPTKKELKKLMKNYGKKIKGFVKDDIDIDKEAKDKLKSGTVEDAIEFHNILMMIEKVKKKDGKKLNFTEGRYLEKVDKFLASVVSSVLGKKYLKEYDLELQS